MAINARHIRVYVDSEPIYGEVGFKLRPRTLTVRFNGDVDAIKKWSCEIGQNNIIEIKDDTNKLLIGNYYLAFVGFDCGLEDVFIIKLKFIKPV